MPDPGRPHDVSTLTQHELEQARRELAASLALARPGSPLQVPILARLAAIDTELATHSGPGPQPGRSSAGRQQVTTAPATQAARYQHTYPGRADQVSQVRRDLARHLSGCPAAQDAILIASELAANAILHSASAGEFFTICCQASPGSVRIEAEDLGGPWSPPPRDPARPHGLDIIAALAGPGNWGTTGDSTGRITWARLTW